MTGFETPTTLPPELEHIIVAIAAHDGVRFPLSANGCCLNLQLTCKRFQKWTVPFLFRVVEPEFLRSYYCDMERDDSNWKVIDTLNTFGNHTTHLSPIPQGNFVGESYKKKVSNIINLCPNIEDIVMSEYSVWIGRVSGVTLVDVHQAVQTLTKLKRFTGTCTGMIKEQLRSPVYLNLTHLDLMGYVDAGILLEFKSLTHLCLDSEEYYTKRPHIFSAALKLITDPKNGCCALRVLVIIADYEWEVLPQDLQEKDSRLVFLHDHRENDLYVSWMVGVNGGMDFWEFSERIVISRQRRYFVQAESQIMDMHTFNRQAALSSEGQLWWNQPLLAKVDIVSSS